jgi:hypothetical protein
MKNIILLTIIGLLTIILIVFGISFSYRMMHPPPDPTIANNTMKVTEQEVIQINVLNANGMSGVASSAKNYLRSVGFDVVSVGNYNRVVEKSIIIDRVGDGLSARKVAYALGISDSLILKEVDSSLFVRSSVILGLDYRTLKPFN